MRRRIGLGIVAIGIILTAQVRADVVITLQPVDAQMSPIAGSVAPGTQVAVNILLAADGDDVPLDDLRLLQFDFAATGAAIELGDYTWFVELSAYAFQSQPTETLPMAGAVSLLFSSDPTLVRLGVDPVRVATIEVTVNGNGTLSAVGSADAGLTSQARIDAGFGPRVTFSLELGNLTGGTFEFSVEETPEPDDGGDTTPGPDGDTDGDGIDDDLDPDDDNDGVDDTEDGFPLDPTETTDSDGDGVGDNADAFPSDAQETTDTDSDGIGDQADTDDDGDGTLDIDDAFPTDPAETADSDGDGIGDNAEQGSNTGPRGRGGLCGIAMLSTTIFICCGLAALRLSGSARRFRGRSRLGRLRSQRSTLS